MSAIEEHKRARYLLYKALAQGICRNTAVIVQMQPPTEVSPELAVKLGAEYDGLVRHMDMRGIHLWTCRMRMAAWPDEPVGGYETKMQGEVCLFFPWRMVQSVRHYPGGDA